METIGDRIQKIDSQLPATTKLVAVSKFHPIEALQQAYDAGQRLFGESRVQEFLHKFPEMPEDVKWHFIGHLQTNKVRSIIGKTALIESVDSEHLIDCIDRESQRAGVVTRVLLQAHVAREETKFGFLPEEVEEYFRLRKFERLKATHISGLMGMASNTDDQERVKSDFHSLKLLYDKIRLQIAPDLKGFDQLSMGMSHDWQLAVSEGSTLIRIGTYIFGERQY